MKALNSLAQTDRINSCSGGPKVSKARGQVKKQHLFLPLSTPMWCPINNRSGAECEMQREVPLNKSSLNK